ncbi:hypothetical protein Tco_1246568 [Tanacetum coccineum]
MYGEGFYTKDKSGFPWAFYALIPNNAEKGIKHWGDKHQLWYRSQINKFSKHKVYSTQKILSVVSVKVKKLHGYGYLEGIVVKRADRQLYKFKESNFVDLHSNDIEEMLILAVQHKLFQLDGSDFVDFIMALRMLTRSLVIKRRVEDLQLGADKLYKFSDETLKLVRDEFHHRVLNFRAWDTTKRCLGESANEDGTSTSTTITVPITTEEKIQKKNDVKARSMLLVALPNEHLLTFSQHKDAKTLFEAIQARFGGNDATKKTQTTLLKQMYENFNAPSIESHDSIFNRLQKITSQLAILGEVISQEDTLEVLEKFTC